LDGARGADSPHNYMIHARIAAAQRAWQMVVFALDQ
jgi:hypothetical protein